ncbi:MAG: hypothetical protein ACI4VI_03595, partial [Acutalibacteraceae bacterium]
MTKRTTKAISVFLVLLMMFSSVPFSGAGLLSFAEDEFNEVNNLLFADGRTETDNRTNSDFGTDTDNRTDSDFRTETDLYEITAGEKITVKIIGGKITYIKFVPQVSGTFIFTSRSGEDTYGYLFDSNKKYIKSDDDGGEDRNFYIVAEFKAGKTYYFGARYYSSSRSGSFTVSLQSMNIDSISFKPARPITLTEGIDGVRTNTDCNEEWFRYRTPSIFSKGNVLTVNYSDEQGTVDYYFDSSDRAFVSADGDELWNSNIKYYLSQSYDNQLSVGENVFTVAYFGIKCEVPFTIVKNPIDSISFTPASPI